MAETVTVFEYVDDQGNTHQADSIGEVPAKYHRTMMAIGIEVEEETEESSSASTEGIDFQKMSDQSGIGLPLALGIVVSTIVCVRAKGFITKIIAGGIVACLLFLAIYTFGETSGFLKTAEKKRPKPTPPPVENIF